MGMHETIFTVYLIVILCLLCCGPVCCFVYAAAKFKKFRQSRQKARCAKMETQWRSENPVKPFDGAKETVANAGWEAWHFDHSELPSELNGESTKGLTSPHPEYSLRSSEGETAYPLQEINFNPGIGNRRRPQCVQCVYPLLMDGSNCCGLPHCHYFEITVIAFQGKKKKQLDGIFNGNVAIGLAARPAPPFRLPGQDAVSVGYHSKKGLVLVGEEEEGRRFSEPWSNLGVTVGCGYDFSEGVVFFTRDGGSPLMSAFAIPDTHLFPTIGADCDVTVVVNMGQTVFRYMPTSITDQIVMRAPMAPVEEIDYDVVVTIDLHDEDSVQNSK